MPTSAEMMLFATDFTFAGVVARRPLKYRSRMSSPRRLTRRLWSLGRSAAALTAGVEDGRARHHGGITSACRLRQWTSETLPQSDRTVRRALRIGSRSPALGEALANRRAAARGRWRRRRHVQPGQKRQEILKLRRRQPLVPVVRHQAVRVVEDLYVGTFEPVDVQVVPAEHLQREAVFVLEYALQSPCRQPSSPARAGTSSSEAA